jgi:hypothetical protein
MKDEEQLLGADKGGEHQGAHRGDEQGQGQPA